MELILKKQFVKEVAKLPSKVQSTIRKLLDELANADDFKSLNIDIKRMEGQAENENYYRIRIGSYRIGLEIIEPKIILITVLSRGDIYKKFPPK